jgi:hypothetical protein
VGQKPKTGFELIEEEKDRCSWQERQVLFVLIPEQIHKHHTMLHCLPPGIDSNHRNRITPWPTTVKASTQLTGHQYR